MAAPDLSSQLTLGLALGTQASFANAVDSKKPVQAMLERQWSGAGSAVFLHGEPASGKSWLLYASVASLPASDAACLDLAELKQAGNARMLDDLDGFGLLCLDNVDLVAGLEDYEEHLFHLVNRYRDAEKHLVLAARQSPRALDIRLRDLASRLNAMQVIRLPRPDDTELLWLMTFKLKERGLEFDAALPQYLLLRLPRDMHSVDAALEQIDRAAWTYKRSLTLPFVRKVLGW
ncbi:HdaA/DnaA family protein [Allohahella marinimesophila]|uniref:HdaA/DnaA family protein n=1 Tax=Allohahella marinimesophila TaxID=1054972 RepID=UPI0031D294CE